MDVIGRILGKYRIVEPIGKGGMGLVFKGYRPDLNHYAAIKILPTHLAEQLGFEERFAREAQTIAQLNHPNILSIIDFGRDDDGLTYLVTKYVTGSPLSDRVGRPMELALVLRYLDQIAAALDHAHGRGFLHRDIKPANILIDEGDWVLLADFGLAKLLAGREDVTDPELAVGTPAYMSPEQASGAAVDYRSDIYSLGVTLYEMLTGQRPFQAEMPTAVILKHIFEQPAPPRQVNPALPEGVDAVLLKSLAKTPADRFSSAGELARSLTQAVAGPIGGVSLHAAPRPAPAAFSTLAPTQIGLQPQSLPPYEVIDSRVVKEFVGREAELAYFEDKLKTARLAIIAGMPGVGKTALALQLAQRLVTLDKTFLHAFHEGEGIDVIIWRLAGFLAWHEQRDLWNMLQTAQQTGTQPPPLEVLFDYVLHMLRGQGYLLILDDFHFVENNPLLNKLIERVRVLLASGDAMLIIVAQRMPSFARESEYQALSGLDASAAQDLLAQRGLTVSAEVSNDLFRLTEGNAQMLTLAIDAARGASSPESFVSRLAESSDIERYLMATIDQRLTEDERAVMSVVAVLLGYPGTRDAIEAILESADGELVKSVRRTLNDLRSRYLLMESEGESGKEYGQHEMVRNFYYNLLSKRERQARHRRAGEFYESEEPDALKAAQHFDLGREFERAAQLATSDVWAMINRGQALALRAVLDQLTARPLSPLTSAMVKIARGQVCAFLGDSQVARDCYQAALMQLEAIGDGTQGHELRARACLGIGDLVQYEAPREALQWLQNGLAELGGTSRLDEAALRIKIGMVQIALGDYPAALDEVNQGLNLLPDGPSPLRASALTSLGTIYGAQGDLQRSRDYALRGLEISERLRDYFRMITLWGNLGIDRYIAGDWNGAIADNRKALALAKRLGSSHEQARIELNLGLMYTKRGDEQQALEHLQSGLELAHAHHLGEHEISGQATLADLYVRQEQLSAAGIALTRAEELAREMDFITQLPEIYRLQAEVYLQEQQLTSAQVYVERSIQLAHDLSLSLEEGMSQRVLGEILQTGRRQEAALAAFERSLALLAEQDPYEAARTKRDYGRALVSGLDRARGTALLQEARVTFEKLGAQRELAEFTNSTGQ